MSWISRAFKGLLNPLGNAPKVSSMTPKKAEEQDTEAMKNDAEDLARKRKGRAATNLTKGEAAAGAQQSKSVLGF